MKIETKILELRKAIPNEQEFGKLNEALAAQKLISKSEYEIAESCTRTDKQGVLWQIITVSCQITIVDTESDEILVNTAFGTGIDAGDMAIAKAQEMALREAWRVALNIFREDNPEIVPEIVVKTPEEEMITQIKALWRWDPVQLPGWIEKRFGGRTIEQLNIVELGVVKNELENYRG